MSKTKNPDPFKPDETNPEWTKEELARAVPASQLLPGVKLPRGRPIMAKDERKIATSIRLDRDVLEHFKAQGKGWQSRLNDSLRAAIGLK